MDPLTISSAYFHKHGPYRRKIQSFADGCSGRVLDLGCGDKPYQEWFNVQKSKYIGMDISRTSAVDVQGDAIRLPFADESFDYVMSNQVLEHVPDPFEFFQEVNRVLRPGGRAFITTNQSFFLHEEPHDYFRYTRYGLKELARRADMSPEDILEVGTTLMHLCCKINIGLKMALPPLLNDVAVAANNILFWPVYDIDSWEDYSIVGIEIEKPR